MDSVGNSTKESVAEQHELKVCRAVGCSPHDHAKLFINTLSCTVLRDEEGKEDIRIHYH